MCALTCYGIPVEARGLAWRNWRSSSIVWALGIQFGSSSLGTSSFTCWVVSWPPVNVSFHWHYICLIYWYICFFIPSLKSPGLTNGPSSHRWEPAWMSWGKPSDFCVHKLVCLSGEPTTLILGSHPPFFLWIGTFLCTQAVLALNL